MGWPAIIGLALSAAGTVAQSSAASATRSAEDKATDSQLQQQLALQGKATQQFNQNLPGNTVQSAQQQIGNSAGNSKQLYAAAQAQPTQTSANPLTLNPVVQARFDAGTQNQGNASAQNAGYSQWGVNQAIQNMLAGQQLGLINNQSQSLANTLAPNLNQAGQSQAGLTGLGSILGTLGTAVGVGGTLGAKQGLFGTAAAKGV